MQRKTFRRIMAQTLAATMVVSNAMTVSAAGLAATDAVPDVVATDLEKAYSFDLPEVKTDEYGNPIDLGGMQIYIADWWSDDDYEDDFTEKQLEYFDWIQDTYNFTIKSVAMSDWDHINADFIDYVENGGNDRNYIFTLRSAPYIADVMDKGLMYDLSTLDCLDFSQRKYQRNKVHELYTNSKGTYAMSGFSSEPRTGMFFNERILTEAGIDPNDIYDLQLSGEWTWEAWTDMMDKVQKHFTDEEGNIVVAGFDADYGVPTLAAIFSNDSSIVGFDGTNYTAEITSEKSVAAITWMVDTMNAYALQRPEGTEWWYYQEAFLNGEVAFVPADAYAATRRNNFEGMVDPIGFVAFPKGESATDYVNAWSDNLHVIPGCYDAEKAWKLAFAYDVYSDVDKVLGCNDAAMYRDKFIDVVDARTIETIRIMLEKGIVRYDELFSFNLGPDFTWNVYPHCDLDEIIAKLSVFERIVGGEDVYPFYAGEPSKISIIDADPENPTGFVAPEVIRDADGNPIDLGGIKITIADWWTYDEYFSGIEAKYIKWIQKTYNFTIENRAVDGWGHIATNFIEYSQSGGDENNYIYVLHGKPLVSDAVERGIMYDLSSIDCLDFSKEKYQRNKVHELYTNAEGIFAMSGFKAEPRTGMYFNERILREAGIDPDDIYDLQASGEWTWKAWTDMMDKVQKHFTDGSGKVLVAGFDCNYNVATSAAVFSNDACYVGFDGTKYTSEFGSDKTMAAINWIVDTMNKYSLERPEGADWDYYKQAFIDGKYAFLPEDAYYGMFGNDLEDEMSDPIGFVAFPKGESATDYVNAWSENLYVIPGCYDADRAWKIAFAYDLYTDMDDFTGYGDAESYADRFIDVVDERSIETIRILCKNGVIRYDDLFNFEIGPNFLWRVHPGCNIEEAVENFPVFERIVGGEKVYPIEPETPGGSEEPGEITFIPPEIIRDELGNPINLGGMEIVIRDWFSYEEEVSEEDYDSLPAYDRARYQYYDWLQEIYNFTIKKEAISDWGETPSDYVEYVTTGGDDNNYIFTLYNNPAVTSAVNTGLMYDLSTLSCLNFNDSKFMNNKVNQLYTTPSGTYAMYAGFSEPRTGIFFNKRILKEAGISPDDIFELQDDLEWNWDAWTDIMDKVQKYYTDEDGNCSVAGFDTNYQTLAVAAIFSNDTSFVDYDRWNKTYVSKFADSKNIEALKWIQELYNNYARKRTASEGWDSYKQAFISGKAAFMVEDAFAMNRGNASGFLPEDEVGFVAFPMGPRAYFYNNAWANNLYVIPGCYDDEKAWKIAFAFDLYSDVDKVLGVYDENVINTYYGGKADNVDGRSINSISCMIHNGSVRYDLLIDELNINYDFLFKIIPGFNIDDIAKDFDRFDKILMGKEAHDGGVFGDHDGLKWEYYPRRGTMVISGRDSVSTSIAELFKSGNIYDLKKVMFEDCTIYDSMNNMFRGCNGLRQISMDGLTLDNVRDYSCLFYDCHNLKELDLSDWTISDDCDYSNMFKSNFDLHIIKAPMYECSEDISIDLGYMHFMTEEGKQTINLTKDFAGKTLFAVKAFITGYKMDVLNNGSFMYHGIVEVSKGIPSDYVVQTQFAGEYWNIPISELSIANDFQSAKYSSDFEVYDICVNVTPSMVYYSPSFGLLSPDGSSYGSMGFGTIADYLNSLKQNWGIAYYDKAVSIINYCATAQEYFGTATETCADKYLTDEEKTLKSLTADEYNKFSEMSTGGLRDVQYLGSSLTLEAGIAVSHYFSVSKDKLKDYSFSCPGGSNYNERTIGDIVIICITVPPHSLLDLDYADELKINYIEAGAITDSVVLRYSVGNYIYMANKYYASDSKLVRVVTAMYRAYEALVPSKPKYY